MPSTVGQPVVSKWVGLGNHIFGICQQLVDETGNLIELKKTKSCPIPYARQIHSISYSIQLWIEFSSAEYGVWRMECGVWILNLIVAYCLTECS